MILTCSHKLQNCQQTKNNERYEVLIVVMHAFISILICGFIHLEFTLAKVKQENKKISNEIIRM